MDQQYLLMYQDENGTDYSWFYTEEEMLEYVNNHENIHVIEGIRVIQCEQILG